PGPGRWNAGLEAAAARALKLDQLRGGLGAVLAREVERLLALLRRQAPPDVVQGDGDPDRAGAELSEACHAGILVIVAMAVTVAMVRVAFGVAFGVVVLVGRRRLCLLGGRCGSRDGGRRSDCVVTVVAFLVLVSLIVLVFFAAPGVALVAALGLGLGLAVAVLLPPLRRRPRLGLARPATAAGSTTARLGLGRGISTTVCGIVRCCRGAAATWNAGGAGSVPA